MAVQSHESASSDPARHPALPLTTARAIAFTLAIVYPAFWLAQFTIDSLPGLVRIVFAGNELKWVRISVLGSYVASAASNDPPGGPSFGMRGLGGETLLGIVVVVALGALVLYLSRRRGMMACGLFAALLGYGGFEQLLRRLWVASPDAGWIASGLLLGALWTMGLRRLVTATAPLPSRYGWRFTSAVLFFTLPLAALLLVFHWAVGMPLLTRFVWVFIPGLVPGALAGIKPVSPGTGNTEEISWKAIAVGGLVTAVLAAAVAFAGRPIETSFVHERAARARAMVSSLPLVPVDDPYPRQFFQKGVNFTAEFGAPYASTDALEALKRLVPYGVNAVALVPYGWMQEGQPVVRVNRGLNVWESDEGLEDVARMAHSLGMKVFLKPQLWARGGSTTDLDFRDPAEREQWFQQYGRFIDHYARLATRIHADLFAVGVELGMMSRYDAEWRGIIAGVRSLYPGPLVYAANFGPDFQDVTFWDALDYIGLDEYYPLPENLSTVELVRRIERVAINYHRPVLFTEVGFPSLVDPQRRPWDQSPRPISLEAQARCYQAIFRAFYGKPWFAGMYWWKVGTNGEGGPDNGSLTPWGKPAMGVVRGWYTQGGR
ncbi:MAG: hypothetical protein KGL59_00375 [Acidobacteriota bacterium]|nr:hypothetical protein [Acidobacteriota bacterium]